MDNQQILDEFNEIYNEEEEIKKELYDPRGIEKGFKKYCLLNKNWVKKYKTFLNNFLSEENKNNYFEYKYITTNYVSKLIVNKIYDFNLPTNFFLVKSKLINLIDKYLTKKDKQSISNYYNIIIGGQCLIMNDYDEIKYYYSYITLYNEEKKDFDDDIDFILRINDREQMKQAINSILTKSIWIYFQELNYNYEDKYKMIKEYKNKKDFIYCLVESSRIKEIYKANNIKERNDIQKEKEIRIEHYEINNLKNKEINIIRHRAREIKTGHNEITQKLNSFLYCLYQIKELENILNQHSPSDVDKEKIELFIDFYKNFENESYILLIKLNNFYYNQ